jgi:hypothetical protein
LNISAKGCPSPDTTIFTPPNFISSKGGISGKSEAKYTYIARSASPVKITNDKIETKKNRTNIARGLNERAFEIVKGLPTSERIAKKEAQVKEETAHAFLALAVLARVVRGLSGPEKGEARHSLFP